jgi:hypothetical protein
VARGPHALPLRAVIMMIAFGLGVLKAPLSKESAIFR